MSNNIAEAITAKNEVIAQQGESLDAVLAALEGKAAGSGSSSGKMRWQKVKEITLEEQTNNIIVDADENDVPIADYAPVAIMIRYDIPADDTQTSTNGSLWVFPSATNADTSIRIITSVATWKTIKRSKNTITFLGNANGIASVLSSGANGLACNSETDACMDGIRMYIHNTEDHFPIQTKVVVQVLSDRG